MGHGIGKLRDHGIIFLVGEIDGEKTEMVCREILEMNFNPNLKRIQLILDSPGGSVHNGFSIIEIMKYSKVPVHTVALGKIMSMGLLIFMAGEKGGRVLSPSTSILSHRFSGGKHGSQPDLLANRKELDLVHDRMIEHYKRYTKLKSKTKVEKELLREKDTYFTTKEAIKFGIADKVEKNFKPEYFPYTVKSKKKKK